MDEHLSRSINHGAVDQPIRAIIRPHRHHHIHIPHPSLTAKRDHNNPSHEQVHFWFDYDYACDLQCEFVVFEELLGHFGN